MIQTKCLCFLFILPFLQAQTYAGDDCVADSRSGSCMLLEKCQPLIEEVRKAGNPMPKQLIEKLRALACGFEDNDPLVCCVPAAVTPTGATSTSANAINKNGEIIGSEVPVDVSGHRNLHLLPTECGMVEDNRILGGNRTGLYEMPWMALLAYESGRRIKLSCGGSLINERYVLTAAHCVSFLSNLKLSHVIIGEHDIRQDPDCERVEGQLYCAPNARNMTIESVIAHPGYRPQTYFDDIALIRLADKVNLTFDNMKPICLPTTPELLNETLEGVQAVVAGWGATEDGLQSPVLLSVALPVVKREDCQAAYKDAIRIYKRQLCAGGLQDKDSCGGDSGGPLMYPGKTSAVGLRYVQRGVVSLGSLRCGVLGYPGIYTRVANYMEWILDNMQP